MDVLITDSMIREFLDTKAPALKIAECVSLCGPSIERVTKEGIETVFHVEATTNRVDAASAYGLAREAAAILPEFKIAAHLKSIPKLNLTATNKLDITILPDEKLGSRFMALLITDVTIDESPLHIKDQLTAIGQRPINNVIDITNYVSYMLGVPMHAFDYDQLTTKKIVVRLSKKGESFVTLDGKIHKTNGGEIVFDNGEGVIIDLPGIMGEQKTAVSDKTKNILLVSEHLDPLRIREASLKLGIRTHAADINEKDPDPEAIETAFGYAALLFKNHAKGHVSSKLFDWYPHPRKEGQLTVSKKVIDEILGIEIPKDEMTRTLVTLGFKVRWSADEMHIGVPTFRVNDIKIEEDIAEEIARIYGYFRFPSPLMSGELPHDTKKPQFLFESKIKALLSGWGGCEVYTQSLVSKEKAGQDALRLKNPLGGDGEYLRTSLSLSLLEAASSNRQEAAPFHLFEISNVYLPKKGKLPEEQTRLSGAFGNMSYRQAKGLLEALFLVLHIETIPLKLTKKGEYYVYEYSVSELLAAHSEHSLYTPIPTFPPQIEDMTVELEDTKVGDVIAAIKNADKLVTDVELIDVYEESYTFRISYMHPSKTLTDEEVAKVRKEILKSLQKNLGVEEKA